MCHVGDVPRSAIGEEIRVTARVECHAFPLMSIIDTMASISIEVRAHITPLAFFALRQPTGLNARGHVHQHDFIQVFVDAAAHGGYPLRPTGSRFMKIAVYSHDSGYPPRAATGMATSLTVVSCRRRSTA